MGDIPGTLDLKVTFKNGSTTTLRSNPNLYKIYKDQLQNYVVKVLDCPSYLEQPRDQTSRFHFQLFLIVPFLKRYNLLAPLGEISQIDIIDTRGQSVPNFYDGWIPGKEPKYRVAWPELAPPGLLVSPLK